MMLASVFSLRLEPNAYANTWQQADGYRFKKLNVPSTGKPGFTSLSTNQTGVLFVNRLSKERYTTNQIYLNGSGVAAGDFDGDGWCDLFFSGLDSENKLYQNLGNWKFEDVTSKARVSGKNIASTGAVFADLNGNGRLDLIINSVGQGTWILLNVGDGTFRATRPINLRRGGISMAIADVDGDSDLDLYITNYRTSTIRDEPGTKLKGRTVNGTPMVVGVNGKSLAEANSIYGQARGCVASDLNGDGRVDIATAQNNDSLVIHLNQSGDTGVRVLLQGKGQNSMAIGASLTLESGKERGPKRELKVVSGYLFQDSAIQIFALKDKQSKLHVTWPNSSRSQSYNIPMDAKTIVISQLQGARVVD